MLKQESYMLALQSAVELQEHGLSLIAKPDTPLGELVDLCRPVFDIHAAQDGISQQFKSAINRADQTAYTAGHDYETADSPHSGKLLQIADEIAPKVQAHIRMTRGVVAPLIKEYKEKLLAYREANAPTTPSFAIEQRELPNIVLDTSFYEDRLAGVLVNAQSVEDPRDLSLVFMQPRDQDFLTSLITLGSERQNKMLAEWLTTKQPAFLSKVFQANFSVWDDSNGGDKDHDYKYRLATWMPRNTYDTVDVALAVYLMAEKLLVDVVETEKKISLAEYRKVLQNYVDTARVVLATAVRAAQTQVSSNILVSELNIQEKRIVVNKSVYKTFLEQGGAPEAVLGMLAGGIKQYELSAILGMKDRLMDSWNTYQVVKETDDRKRFIEEFRAYALNLALAGLRDPLPVEKEYCQDQVLHAKNVAATIAKTFSDMVPSQLADIEDLALTVIAKCRFYYTPAYDLLKEMYLVAVSNPNIDSREAAGLAAKKYLCGWIKTQVLAVR